MLLKGSETWVKEFENKLGESFYGFNSTGNTQQIVIFIIYSFTLDNNPLFL